MPDARRLPPQNIGPIRWRAGVACAVGAWALVAAASAQTPADLARRFPPGSLKTREQAALALSAADEVERRLETDYQAEVRRCEHVILVNQCQDGARRAQMLGRREARRVELEAHDLDRTLRADELKTEREDRQVRSAADEAQRAQREQRSEEANQRRQDQALTRRQDAARAQAAEPQTRAQFEQRQREHEQAQQRRAQTQPQLDLDNRRRFDDKQAQARAATQARARAREENARHRADRERERAQQRQDAEKSAPPAAGVPSTTSGIK